MANLRHAILTSIVWQARAFRAPGKEGALLQLCDAGLVG